ncbi:hypothetical protein JQ628_25700 [Bradyrhizobium lablabi]|uniref:hypothetical protein n=1 Tax=Bradyrhizobium lablabi TaxID=722472 RepID=UPI001BAC3437|nr:hypothetical protein [Bradyrhizobium lablabi]MBR1124942.1 hypothetical protein [Bradyrhizobium lablabi]
MADDTIASVIALHQPKRARTGTQQPRVNRARKRRKAKVAKSQSSESLIPVEFLPLDSTPAQSVVAPPLSEARPAGWSVASLVLAAAAFMLAVVGVATNGWFARSLGSSDMAGWLFLAIGVAADLAALVLPICAARLWHTGQRAVSIAAWSVWAMTFAFAVIAGIGFASVNIADVTTARASRSTPAVTAAQSALSDAMSARDRECGHGIGKFCREREAMVAERRQILDAAMVPIRQTADPQTEAAIKIVAWLSYGMLRPSGDDFAMLRLVLLALLPQIGGILLMVSRSAWRPDASRSVAQS